MSNTTISQKFWSKVDKRGEDDCWPWKLSKTNNGYGRFVIHQVEHLAHRMAWALFNKREIPEGMLICHTCDNKLCCNPKHLYCGTHRDNQRDRQERNPTPAYILGANAKLSAEEIMAIRLLKNPVLPNGKRKLSLRKVASMFNVTYGTIDSIWKSERYLCKGGEYA